MLRRVGVWVLVVACGLGLLYSRFDWSVDEGRFAKRAFVLSAYLFAILLPTVYYGARRLLRDRTAATILTGVVFVATTLPWHLLGFEGYYQNRPRHFEISQLGVTPSLEFFPGGTLRTFPYDWLFMPLLFAFGAAIVWGIWWLRERGALTRSRTIPLLLTAAFAVICVQTYLHTSMRSPYTYLAYFQAPKADQHWYHIYHFKDASGASEGDQFVFSPLEDLAAQASFFVNTFYVWIGLNCLFWLAAVAAAGRWVGTVTNPRIGVIAAALVTVGPGFVSFAGTTGMYLQGFAVVMIALWAFEELIVRGARRTADFALFAGVMALSMLVYDLLPVLVSLLVYGLAPRVRAGPLIASLAAALVLSRLFPVLVTGVLDIRIDPTNSRQLSRGVDAVKDLLLHPSLSAYYVWIVDLVPGFGRRLLQAFFVLPIVLAVVALPRMKDAALRWLAGSLLVTGFAVVAVFVIGEQVVGEAPRLVYLMAAIALDAFRLPGRLRAASPWIGIGVMAILVNVDIFGFPTLYVEYFVGTTPAFLP
jgi:hypothetical protein